MAKPGRLWSTVTGAIDAYLAHDDPLARACNVIALIIVGNQPFYPLYIHWLLGHGATVSMLTFLSTPFFAAVPLVARRRSRWGRILLVVVGVANTAMVTKIFGQAAGVELFLLPCVLIPAAFFHPSERALALALAGLGFAVYLGLDGRYGPPLCACTPADQNALLGLHALSVGTLVVFMGFLAAGIGARRPDTL